MRSNIRYRLSAPSNYAHKTRNFKSSWLPRDVVITGAGFTGLAPLLESRYHDASVALFCDKGFLTDNLANSKARPYDDPATTEPATASRMKWFAVAIMVTSMSSGNKIPANFNHQAFAIRKVAIPTRSVQAMWKLGIAAYWLTMEEGNDDVLRFTSWYLTRVSTKPRLGNNRGGAIG